jgi:parallel beta-helix repeat protein
VTGSGVKIVGPGTATGFKTRIASEGIYLGGGNGSVRGVTVTGNRDGVDLDSAGNSVRGNVVTDNGRYGIVAIGTGNTIIGNYAQGNSTFDLYDANVNCDSNVWNGNDFGTAFPSSCIN